MSASHRFHHTPGIIALLGLLALAACGSPSTTTPTSTLLGGNIIVNGNAEQGMCAADTGTVITPIPGWTPTGEITPIQYAASAKDGDLSAMTPGPRDAGTCYLWGGPSQTVDNTLTSMTQTASVSTDAALIDTQAVSYALSAWLGGFGSQDDNAVLSIQFLSATGSALGMAMIGPVLAADRSGTSELLSRRTSGKVPVGTRSIKVTLTMTKVSGSDNDGLADDLSLLLAH
jgi:hypothetical protein